MKKELLRKIMTRGRQLFVVLVVLVSGLAVTSCSEDEKPDIPSIDDVESQLQKMTHIQ